MRESKNLVYFSRKAAEIQTRVDLRERNKGHMVLNSEFVNCLKVGVRTIAYSPDCS